MNGNDSQALVVNTARNEVNGWSNHGTAGPRLLDDARRLWRRVRQFIDAPLVTDGVDRDALELACYAIQLPQKRRRTAASGKPIRPNLRARAEEAAELLRRAPEASGIPEPWSNG